MSKFKPGDLVVPVEVYLGTPHTLLAYGFILAEVIYVNAIFLELVTVSILVITPEATVWGVGQELELCADRFRKLS